MSDTETNTKGVLLLCHIHILVAMEPYALEWQLEQGQEESTTLEMMCQDFAAVMYVLDSIQIWVGSNLRGHCTETVYDLVELNSSQVG